MLVQFEKRIAFLKGEIDSLKASGTSELQYLELIGALNEAEKLYSFYKSQMVDKGRILPQEEKPSDEELKNRHNDGYREG